MTIPDAERRATDAYLFFALACAITWALDAPVVIAMIAGRTPPEIAMLMGGIGALGPTIAAMIVSRWRGGEGFARWRVHPGWIVLGLVAMPALHLPATLLEVALGGEPTQWFYPPERPEHFAALVLFSFGEEPGWRGFAYPRMAERYGPVIGSLILGVVWALWHLLMWWPPSALNLALGVAEMALGSVVMAWVFERSGRSILSAVAFHMSAHLDNVFRAPEHELRLRLLRLLFLAIAALFAARSLEKQAGHERARSSPIDGAGKDVERPGRQRQRG